MPIDWSPPDRKLRQFGGCFLALCAGVGALLFWKWQAPTAAVWVWSGAAAVTCAGWAAPVVLRVLYRGLMAAAFPIGFVVSHLILAAIFFGVLTPIALVSRAFGADPLKLRFDRSAGTYWIPHAARQEADRYFRQF